MNRIPGVFAFLMSALCFCFVISIAVPDLASAAENAAARLTLPKARTTGGMPLMEALSQRKTTRKFSDRQLSEQELSDLLWAVWGVNREDGRRTAPTSMNKKNIELYVVLESGVWHYDGVRQELSKVLNGDMRSKYGGAPVTLLYAAEDGYYASGMHVGSLYQNAGLYCASVGLGNVVKRTGVDALDGQLQLPAGYRVFIVQSIGWPE